MSEYGVDYVDSGPTGRPVAAGLKPLVTTTEGRYTKPLPLFASALRASPRMNLLIAIAHFVVRCTRPGSAGILRSLNAARSVLGVPELDCIPAGHPRRIGACPVSRALPGVVGVDGVAFALPDQALAVASVWGTSVELSPTGVYVAKLPRNVEQFVRDFDLGAYPEYEADSMALDPDLGENIVAQVNASRRAA